eukprot:g3777.t1
MDFRSLLGGMGGRGPSQPTKVMDTAEVVQISSLSLLKMLKHARAGVPMEVMGLMLGKFVDDYTIEVVDVFSMPQSGTGVSVEAVDPVYQTEFTEKLAQTEREEIVVGWYHSHPGFGPWLSGVDVNTQRSFEQLNSRAVAVVIDPIQSVKGKVVIDAFRLINEASLMLGMEPRQTTSMKCYLNKPSIQALIHGLNRAYYSIGITWRKNALEERMLKNLYKKKWTAGLLVDQHSNTSEKNAEILESLAKISERYNERVIDETGKSPKELVVAYAGMRDPRKELQTKSEELSSLNIDQVLGTMLNSVVF